jgi:hypothetical protein
VVPKKGTKMLHYKVKEIYPDSKTIDYDDFLEELKNLRTSRTLEMMLMIIQQSKSIRSSQNSILTI